MGIFIKSEEQIEKMRVAGKILKDLIEVLKNEVRPGVTTLELDKIAESFRLQYAPL